MKRGWKILLGLAAALGLLVALLAFSHYRAKWAVEAYRKYLRAQGEKLGLAELIPPFVPAESNGAPALLAARSRLSWNIQGYAAAMTTLGPGHALVVWALPILPNQQSSNAWPALDSTIISNRPALADVRAALARPAVQFQLDYHQGFGMLLPDLSSIGTVANSLSTAVMVDLHAGRVDDALADLKAGIALVRADRGEPVLLIQATRTVNLRDALGATWQTLQYPGVTEPQWAALQRDWESFNLLDTVEASLSMERAFGPEMYETARSSYTNFVQAGGGNLNSSFMDDVGQAFASPGGGFGAIMNRRPRYWLWKWWWSCQDELCRLQTYQAGLYAARSTRDQPRACSRSRPVRPAHSRLQTAYSNAEPRFIMGGSRETAARIRIFLLRMAAAETQRRLVVTAIALKRHQLLRGAYPQTLKDLAPDFLPELPLDLMDGKPLRYHPAPNGGFVLYSVGEDGRDNGGDATPTEAPGNRFKNWWRARDAVWPSPATPRETRAFETNSLAEFTNYQTYLNRRVYVPVISNTPPSTTKTN